MVLLLIAGVLLLLVLVLPQFWVRRVLQRYSAPRDDFPGTGGEFARHLLNRFGLHQVRVESTDQGDHYDPREKVVRLGADHYQGRSLTAVTIAAHEVAYPASRSLDLRRRLGDLTAQRLALACDPAPLTTPSPSQDMS